MIKVIEAKANDDFTSTSSSVMEVLDDLMPRHIVVEEVGGA